MESLLNTGAEIKFDGDKTITVKRLSVVDVFKFARLLGKLGKGAIADLASQFKVTQAHEGAENLTEAQKVEIEEQKKAQAQQLGFALFGTLAEFEDDLLDFLAGLTDMSLADFKTVPPDVALEVISVVANGEDLKRFFDKARALSAKVLPQA